MPCPRASSFARCCVPPPRSVRRYLVLLLLGFAAGATIHRLPAQQPGRPQAAAKPPAFTNRLAKETSPYLLLHAHNPVDWYPWGEEALAKAKREQKVIFLSVGYSSCHRCHVMERESFLDAEIARLLNEQFVCIKVDREERPDIDAIYMSALQIYHQATGSGRGGGWPMSMFLTPDCKPFFGGTYFPARDGDRGGATGFLTIVKRVQEFWTQHADRIREDAETITGLVKTQLASRRQAATRPLDVGFPALVLNELDQQFDPQWGGFGFAAAEARRPKFPEPSNLLFLLDRMGHARVAADDKERSRRMVVKSLEQMAMGGIWDHLGGGFHRYSVDRFWHIPHFEKMLYDNAQLTTIYTEALLATGRHDFRRVVEQTIEFAQRELLDASGAYYAALDAESEGEEGKYYRWEKAELDRLLTGPDAVRFAKVYGLDAAANFDEKFYVPQRTQLLADAAKAAGLTEVELENQLDPLRRKLLAVRAQRPRPLTDTKILTSWNGLMIRGLADAGRGLKRPEYTQAAARAADFILQKVRTKDGKLLRTYSQGAARLNAYVDDYAFLVDGLLALYRASGERRWLTAADELTAKQLELFWDEAGGGFFFTSDDHESLIARGMDPVDGAEPSGNSVSVGNLLFLANELRKPDYRDKGQRTVNALAGLLESTPSAAPRLAISIAQLLQQGPP